MFWFEQAALAGNSWTFCGPLMFRLLTSFVRSCSEKCTRSPRVKSKFAFWTLFPITDTTASGPQRLRDSNGRIILRKSVWLIIICRLWIVAGLNENEGSAGQNIQDSRIRSLCAMCCGIPSNPVLSSSLPTTINCLTLWHGVCVRESGYIAVSVI